jgi:hypothetical protein
VDVGEANGTLAERLEGTGLPIQTIREELEVLGISTKWTLAAEARDFRETQAIERALSEDPEKGRQWLERQK